MPYLTLEEQRWRLAIENGTFGVWDLDPGLELVHYAPQWKARLGIPRQHAADSTWFWRCRVHPADFDAMARSLRAHLDGDSPSYQARFRLRVNGSGYRTVLSRGRVVGRDPHGTATRMVGTMVDLTDRPVASAVEGLVIEAASPVLESHALPFHAVLGVSLGNARPGSGAPHARAAQRLGLVDQVDDLLEMACREGSPPPAAPHSVAGSVRK